MAGPASSVRLECLQGVDFSETFLFFNAPASGSKEVTDLVPLDFTNATGLRMMVKPTSDAAGTAVLSLTLGSGLSLTAATITPGPAVPAYNNGVVITITKAQSLSANGGKAIAAYYDLLVDWADGTTAILLRGSFNLAATGTR